MIRSAQGNQTAYAFMKPLPKLQNQARITRNGDAIVLVLHPVHGRWPAPPVQRLKAALKALLRAYGLRCVACRPVTKIPSMKKPCIVLSLSLALTWNCLAPAPYVFNLNGTATNLTIAGYNGSTVLAAINPYTNISSTVTAGIQESITNLLLPSDVMHPGGGEIDLPAGILQVGQPILFSRPVNGTLYLRGVGNQATVILQTNLVPAPCLRLLGISPGTNRYTFKFENIIFASVTNAMTNLVEVDTWANGELDNCVFGSWQGMTNNQDTQGHIGLGFTSTGGGLPHCNLVGIAMLPGIGAGADELVFNHDFFTYLACGAYLGAVDHGAFNDCFFTLNNQAFNDWPQSSIFNLNAAFVVNAAAEPNGTLAWYSCYYYKCNAGYLVVGANTANMQSINDGFESSNYGYLLSPASTFQASFVHGLGTPPELVSTFSPYITLAVAESNRVTFFQPGTGIGLLPQQPNGPTNFLGGTAYNCSLSGLNVTFSTPVSGPAGVQVFTNAGSQLVLVCDPNETLNLSYTFLILTNFNGTTGTPICGWNGGGNWANVGLEGIPGNFPGQVWFNGSTEYLSPPAPYATMNPPDLQVTWAGSSAVPPTSISPTGSPFSWTNTNPFNVSLYIYGGTVSAVAVNGGQIASGSGQALFLQPNERATVTYSGTPTMKWKQGLQSLP
jgi:hypothetical protein